MVLAINCKPGFSAEQLPLTARNGAGILRLVVKAGYSFAAGNVLEQLPEAPKPQLSDELWSDPSGSEAVKIESDVSLEKPYTDLIVNGYAMAKGGRPVRSLEAGLSYDGRVLRGLQVFGERVWTSTLGGWLLSEPLPFERMAITYGRAYGGHDDGGLEVRNPWGTGYATKVTAAFDGTRAPNIELPDKLIRSPTDRPPPAGLGVVARHARPRTDYTGTYDAAWQEDRFPLLPEDFDNRFNQCVDPSQWVPRPRGGEVIGISGMSREGLLSMALPPCAMRAGFHYKKRSVTKELDLDSIIVDTEAQTVTLTWRGTVDVHGDPFQLEETVIDSSNVGRSAPARCC